jgi:hypothetical protein
MNIILLANVMLGSADGDKRHANAVADNEEL